MKNLLTVTAISEFGTGLIMVMVPSRLVKLLLGSPIDSSVALTVARVAGVAILALAVACWLSRRSEDSTALIGLVGAMVLYNTAIVLVLVHAAIGLAVSGIGLWPVVIFHTGMSVWCILGLHKSLI